MYSVFGSRRDAEPALEHLVQEFGFERTDGFVWPAGDKNSARTDAATHMFHEIRREQSPLQDVNPSLSQGQCSVPEHPSRTGQEAARVARGGLFSFHHQRNEQPRSIELHPRSTKPSLSFRL
jgi:hypothetical protein